MGVNPSRSSLRGIEDDEATQEKNGTYDWLNSLIERI